ncbi:Hypothetical protein POVN_LOCUS644 [uncultured virus]|nr:Hypothetical protein POVN_LOCUS644 [uncultured virus]
MGETKDVDKVVSTLAKMDLEDDETILYCKVEVRSDDGKHVYGTCTYPCFGAYQTQRNALAKVMDVPASHIHAFTRCEEAYQNGVVQVQLVLIYVYLPSCRRQLLVADRWTFKRVIEHRNHVASAFEKHNPHIYTQVHVNGKQMELTADAYRYLMVLNDPKVEFR